VRPATRESTEPVFDGRLGFGTTPAVLVVDFVRSYITPGEPLFAPDVIGAIEATAPLLTAARRARVPVIYTRVQYQAEGRDGGVFVQKIPLLRSFVAGAPCGEIVHALAPREGDVVITKQYASAFFGTTLAPMLTAQGVDTLILTGCSTSGCVRATAVDGCQHGFRVMVPRECVADRARGPHDANLFDIDAKYGDVIDREVAVDWLGLLEGMRRLP